MSTTNGGVTPLLLRTEITLTLAEANEVLGLLAELPIKYVPLYKAVQRFFAGRFQEPAAADPRHDSRHAAAGE
jgi:hypothetical protein